MSSRQHLHRRDLRHGPVLGPLAVPAGDALHENAQFAALPWRRQADGSVTVLLITSRETRRWVIPKGWPMIGRSPAETAAQEAYEEAGLVGEAATRAIGAYTYDKRLRDGTVRPVTVQVFALEVMVERLTFPEHGQREKAWMSPQEAAERVDEPDLKALLLGFRPF
jgi:8-oxo-dGTP pyrophosphatase MutT (NUDIX family)